MFWLIWKQQRKQFLLGLVAVAAYAVFILVTGVSIKNYRSNSLVSTTWLNIVRSGYAIPVLLGMFWGAPLISSEYESGTNKFIWTQGISRRKWLFSKLGITTTIASICGLVCSLFASWWFQIHGVNGAVANRFDAPQFGATGLVPVAYAIFAVGLGVAIGAWLKKPVAAIAATLIGYAAILFLIAGYIRPHYMQAYHYTYKPSTGCVTTHVLDTSSTNCAYNDPGPPSLRHDSEAWIVRVNPTGNQTIFYQPGNRYWRFQLIETGIYAGLIAATIGAAYGLVLKHDA